MKPCILAESLPAWRHKNAEAAARHARCGPLRFGVRRLCLSTTIVGANHFRQFAWNRVLPQCFKRRASQSDERLCLSGQGFAGNVHIEVVMLPSLDGRPRRWWYFFWVRSFCIRAAFEWWSSTIDGFSSSYRQRCITSRDKAQVLHETGSFAFCLTCLR